MKKHLLLALLTLLIPSLASAVSPVQGDYAGTAWAGIIPKHVTFRLIGTRITNFEVNGLKVGGNSFKAGSHGHFSFKDAYDAHKVSRYTGHGVWEHDKECAGDFRDYLFGASDVNVYYTWRVHLVHQLH